MMYFFKTLLFLVALFPTVSFGATLSFESKLPSLSIGEIVEVRLLLEAKDEAINAIEGELLVSPNFSIKEIRDGGTIINFWIENPEIVQNKSRFAGVIPGGYLGEKGIIFSIILEAKERGSGVIFLRNVRGLIQDEEGTEATLNSPRLSIDIISPSESIPPPEEEIILEDTVPPEPFEPIVESYSELFDGKWFVAFSTSDKGSGIARFEIQESNSRIPLDNEWSIAENPQLLLDQERKSYIHIRAIDNAGNERIATISPAGGFLSSINANIWVILIFIALLSGAFFLLYKRFRRSGEVTPLN